VLGAFLVFLNKFYLVACGIAAKAMEGVCFGVYPAAWFVVLMERTFYVVAAVGF